MIRGEFRFNTEFAAPERIEIDPAKRSYLWRCRERSDRLELRRIDLENSARAGAIGALGILIEIERQLKAGRTRTFRDRIKPRCQRGRERRDQRGHLAERRSA